MRYLRPMTISLLLMTALAACAGGPGRDGPRDRSGGGPEQNTGPRTLKTSAGLLFARFDSNQDMQITRAELNIGIDGAFRRADQNNDQDIAPLEFESFADASLDGGKSPPFRIDFDRDVDGRISFKEFQTELSAISESLDANKDGVLSQAEMLKSLEAAETRRRPSGGQRPEGANGGPGPDDGGEGGGRRPR